MIEFQRLNDLLPPPVEVYHCHYTAQVMSDPDLEKIQMPPNSESWVLGRKVEYKVSRHGLFQAIRRIDPSINLPPETLWPGPDRYPHWPESISGSISHKSGRVVIAVASAKQVRSIGVDIETVMDVEKAERVATRILTPDELLHIHPSHIAKTVSLLFSAKESLYKALYPEVKKYVDFQGAQALDHTVFQPEIITSAGRLEFKMRLTKKWSETLPKGSEYTVNALYMDGAWMTAVQIR
jgi:enterobactin synthetase component D